MGRNQPHAWPADRVPDCPSYRIRSLPPFSNAVSPEGGIESLDLKINALTINPVNRQPSLPPTDFPSSRPPLRLAR